MTVENISQPRGLESGRPQEWYLQLARDVQKAAEITKCVVDGGKEISRINEAISRGDKEQMWNLLQQTIAKYKRLICLLSPITKITVIAVSKEDITVADLRYQLQLITGFVFARNCLCSGAKVAFKENVSQIIETII